MYTYVCVWGGDVCVSSFVKTKIKTKRNNMRLFYFYFFKTQNSNLKILFCLVGVLSTADREGKVYPLVAREKVVRPKDNNVLSRRCGKVSFNQNCIIDLKTVADLTACVSSTSAYLCGSQLCFAQTLSLL